MCSCAPAEDKRGGGGGIGIHQTESKMTNRYVVVLRTFHFKGWLVYVELFYIELMCTLSLSKTQP
jgi:hypothetical protein